MFDVAIRRPRSEFGSPDKKATAFRNLPEREKNTSSTYSRLKGTGSPSPHVIKSLVKPVRSVVALAAAFVGVLQTKSSMSENMRDARSHGGANERGDSVCDVSNVIGLCCRN